MADLIAEVTNCIVVFMVKENNKQDKQLNKENKEEWMFHID